jgi:hypothetical protein
MLTGCILINFKDIIGFSLKFFDLQRPVITTALVSIESKKKLTAQNRKHAKQESMDYFEFSRHYIHATPLLSGER